MIKEDGVRLRVLNDRALAIFCIWQRLVNTRLKSLNDYLQSSA